MEDHVPRERPIHFLFPTALLIVIVGVLFLAANRKPPSENRSLDPPDGPLILNMRTMTQVAEFDKAMATDQCVIFIDVDWSMTSVQSRSVVSEFVQKWEREGQGPSVDFYRVDASVQKGPVFDAVRTWLSSDDPQSPILYAGNGAILWVRNGAPMDHVGYAFGVGASGLCEWTLNAFSH